MMSTSMLPSSPSWYCSRVIDSNANGITCFGTKNSLCVWDVSRSPPVSLCHIPAHPERVTGVSLCKSPRGPLRCCSAGEDGKIRVWDLESGELLAEHEGHAEKKPSAVQWSPLVEDLIISGDDRGVIVVWTLSSNDVKILQPELGAIYCLSCCPHDQNLIAIGYKSGAVIIIDISRQSNHVIQKLKGHDEEIHCICWCPEPGEDLDLMGGILNRAAGADSNPSSNDGYLLATGSRDRTIRIWSYSRGRPVHILKLPTNTGYSKGRDRYDDQRARVWVTLLWVPNQPAQIISSSFNGELLLWDIGQKKPSWRLMGAGDGAHGHTRIIFNVALGGPNLNHLSTISMDRQLIVWNLESLSPEWCIPTLGGFAYALAFSPFQPGRLAVGVGDNMVRLWHADNASNPFMVQTFWQGIKSKVTSLAWHPEREGKLAYGTEDGRVGILDSLSANKPPVISSTYHKRTVYVVAWGPPAVGPSGEDPADSLVLYSCGDGVILQHVPSGMDKEAKNIDQIIAQANSSRGKTPGRSEISWKPDFTVVALGNDDGSIDILQARTMKLLASVQVHHKLVNCIRWHPLYTAQSGQCSPCACWMASGSNETIVSVVNLESVLAKVGEISKPSVITESFRRLEGHTHRITGLSWSTHADGILVSASYDSTAQVWDVNSGEGLANFRGHLGRLMSVTFSDTDPDLVYSGGDDYTVHSWRPSEQRHPKPPSGRDKKKKKKPKAKGTKPRESAEPPKPCHMWVNPDDQSAEVKEKSPLTFDDELAQLQAMLQKKKSELIKEEDENESDSGEEVPATSPAQSVREPQRPVIRKIPTPEVHQAKKNSKPESKEKKRKVKSLFPNSSVMDNRGKSQTQQDCVELAKALYSDEPSLTEEQFHLGSFVNRSTTHSLLNREIVHHTSHSNVDHQVTLSLMKGSITDILQEAADKNALNDYLMSLAPLASPQMWRELSVKYASQLEKEGFHHKAASHLIAANQVHAAIDLLCRNNLLKEALCFAQSRLSPFDPLLQKVCTQWAQILTKDGNFEMAAKCHLCLRQPLEAARLLARRADLPSICTALDVCLAARETSAAATYAKKYVQQTLLVLDWPAADQVAGMDEKLQALRLQVHVHESLVRQLHFLGCLEDAFVAGAKWLPDELPASKDSEEGKLPGLLIDLHQRDTCVPWPVHCVEGSHWAIHLVCRLHPLARLQLSVPWLQDTLTHLKQLKDAHQSQPGTAQLLVELSLEVTLGLVHMLLGDTESAACCWAQGLAQCHAASQTALAEGICRLLLPRGPSKLFILQQHLRALRLSKLSGEISSHDRPTPSGLTRSRHTSQSDLDISCPNDHCQPTDCLQAFYYLTVLRYLLRQTPEACSIENPLVDLAENLLWDMHAKKAHYTATLAEIHSVFSRLVALNADELPSVRYRRISGEYLTMHPARTNSLGVHIPRGRLPHQMIPMSPVKTPVGIMLPLRKAERSTGELSSCDDYVPMYPENPECTELCSPVEETPPKESSPNKDIVFHLEPLLDEDDADRKTESPEADLDLPAEWHEMPVEEKYLQEYVTMEVLAKEQERVLQEMEKFKMTQDCIFPNPLGSARELLQLSQHLSLGKTPAAKHIAQWGCKQGFTREDQHFFHDFLQSLSSSEGASEATEE